jgi:hypothetical protein
MISLTALHSTLLFAEVADNAITQPDPARQQTTQPPSPSSSQPVTPPQPAQQAATEKISWLGVALGKAPPALSTQLGALIPAGQGVMIKAVDANSPAAKAGLQRHDILLVMGDQKLYSAQQLSALVKAAKPGSQVTFQGVHQGELKQISVTLGERSAPDYRHQWQRPYPENPLMPPALPGGSQQQNLSWDSFECVQVKTLPDGRYHAEVAYKDENGEQKSFIFEGKREEIIKQIQEQQELPVQKRQALLNALNMRPDAVFNQPFFHGNFFNDPFFNNPYGADPFFRHGFPRFPDFGGFFRGPYAPRSPHSAPVPHDGTL